VSDTPKTDAAFAEYIKSASPIAFRDLARQLERELAAANARQERSFSDIAVLQAELTALRADKARLIDLLQQTHCPNCDGSGSYAQPQMSGDGEEIGVEQVQCQWCFETKSAMKGQS
jgi:hypothetical protein